MPKPVAGSFRDVVIANIVATGVGKTGCSVSGLPDHPVENVAFNNITLSFEGGGARELATRPVPEVADKYPESKMFGDLPTYGFYCRHVRGLRFSNVQLRATAPDLRHAMAFDDVENLAVDGLDVAFFPGGASVLGMTQCRGAMVRGCTTRLAGGTFLQVKGADSDRITLTGNDLGGMAKAVECSDGAPEGAVTMK
jgi:hypothetical protein